MPNTNHQELWGDIFEITVKRGIIHHLLHSKLLSATHTSIQPWVTYTIHDLRCYLNTQLAATDENYLNLAHHYLDHLLVLGYGLGWTCIREVLKKFNKIPSDELQLTALWCPLKLPDRKSEKSESDKIQTLHEFWQALHLNGQYDTDWLNKGGPARADLFLLLKIASIKPKLFLLCLEFSLNVPPRLEDFSESEAHLHELENYMYLIEKRGVFTRLNSEISDDITAFSSKLASHISAFTSSDKPFFKLCQASSYLTQLAHTLHNINLPLPLEVQAIAITAAGVEGLSACFDTTSDPRIKLLETLGETYRKYNTIPFDYSTGLYKELNFALDCIKQALPQQLKQEMSRFLNNPPVGEELRQVITETITEFHNPDTSISLNELSNWISSNKEVTTLFGQTPHLTIHQILQNSPEHNPKLRDLHAAAVWAGLNAAKSGQINILALEGYPGIGKTTAVKDWLHQQTTGFLFFYFSPRVVINSKVMTELGTWKPTFDAKLQLSNVLTLTSDSSFINRATSQAKINSRYISGAVAFSGIDETNFLRPKKGILFLNTSQVQALDQYGEYTGSHYNVPVSNDRSLIIQDKNIGVWRTLAMAAKQALEVNSNLNRVAITAAIQGYREFNNSKTTVNSLSDLFQYKHHKLPLGKLERQRLAERLPTIVVMMDEITGDSAGVLATQQLCLWLEQEFINPFGNNSPFRVILIIADASLSNAQILQRHVESVNVNSESITSAVPDKILISHGYGIQPLRLIAKSLRLGLSRSWPTLHIEAFGFPAIAPLTLRYDLRFLPLIRPPKPNELSLTPRRVISDATKSAMQDQAQELIMQSLKETSGQIIFFAQDREFLETVASKLKASTRNNANFSDIENKIVTLHSKVTQAKRDQLIQPEIRDSMRVILMTSSGSRGVSFPKATHIIALIPRFNIETNLMELAQLIYRGRGYYSDSNQPEMNISGDHAQRTLTFLINDFVISDADTEPQVQLNQWAGKALDFLTFVILLRAIILTRISGNAGMPQQSLAVVPVGNISSAEFSMLLADSVRSMMVELKVLLADSNYSNKSGLKSILQRIENLFRNAEYTEDKLSISTNGIAKKLSFNLTNDAQTLVSVFEQKIIPDNVYCVGPLWLEYMQDVNASEQYEFELFYSKQREEFQFLHKQLNALNLDFTLPKNLRQQAQKLYTILHRIINDDAIKYVAVKSDQPRQVWNCFPANYPYFMSTLHSNNKILDHKGWWDTLNRSIRSICSVSSVFPALPVYQSKPFLVIITSGDPTDLKRALDDRYFYASSTVNLLNALLFA